MGIPWNTQTNDFRISEYVLTYQKHVSTEKLGWEYLGILKKMPLGYQNLYLLIKKHVSCEIHMYLLIKNMCRLKN